MAAGDKQDDVNNSENEVCKLYQDFQEIKEVEALIETIPDIFKDQIATETALERFTYIVNEYQEQPHLIDPHLEKLVNRLLEIGRDVEIDPVCRNLAFTFLYLITKMRGPKVVVRLFPHEVADVEPILALLNQQDSKQHELWETRYILLLWLSMACIIPFDLVRLDSNVVQESGEYRKPVMDRIMEAAQQYLTVTDKSRDAAAFLMSKFMTRPDVKAKKLPEFIGWSLKTLDDCNYEQMTGAIKMLGILSTLALLFKHGKREDFLPHAPVVLEKVQSLNLFECNNTILRKTGVKVIQRLGLTFLKARVAKWRYQRGSRSLADNIKLSKEAVIEKQNQITTTKDDDDEEEEEYDIPDEIEEVIELLLKALKDKDNIVRWSAAKGVGRITGRLPKELADDVLESLMDLYSLQNSDGAWHGGCLALAELGRRGLLLPQRLPDVVPVVLRALAYDEKRGFFSVGSHVRDAACYVCWAFARAYEPEEVKPYVNRIASALIVASLFDREVNVRKCASAAFQENVGRQGTFPHGIDILTTVDYFSVGNRNNCYLDLSVYVAQFEEYTKPLIDHLAEIKITHWDSVIRELTAKALHNLTFRMQDYVCKTVLPALLAKTTGIDLHARHSSILCVAEIIHALSKLTQQQNRSLVEYLGQNVIDGVKDIVVRLNEAKLFRGMGGELMRKAVCCLIEKVSLSNLPYHDDPILEQWQEILDDCLIHVEPEIQASAVSAMAPFFSAYYRNAQGQVIPSMQEKVIDKYLRELRSTVELIRMGYSQAVGAFPKFMLAGKLRAVIAGLIQASTITEKEKMWAESRRDALKALTSVCLSVGVEEKGDPTQVVCSSNIDQIYEAYLCVMKDYTLDSRGDVGAWVREMSMTGLQQLTSLVVNKHLSLLQPVIYEHIFKCIIQQCCEKIDRTRAHAGNVFANLLYHKPPLPHIPHFAELQSFFPEEDLASINWAAPADTFPRFTQLLKYPTYTYSVLLGLTVSVGGLTESLVKHSSASLESYIRNISKDMAEMNRITDTLIQIFKDHQKVDRVSLPMLKMLDQLLAKGCFDCLLGQEDHPFPMEVVNLVKAEINKSGDPQKLLASCDVFCDWLQFPGEVRKKCLALSQTTKFYGDPLQKLPQMTKWMFCGLLQFPGEVRKKCLTSLCIFLCHRYPRIRKASANKFYEVVVMYEDIAPIESLDEIMTLLSETIWDNEVSEVKPIRNQICELLDVPIPIPIKKKTT